MLSLKDFKKECTNLKKITGGSNELYSVHTGNSTPHGPEDEKFFDGRGTLHYRYA